ncbi:MAG: hypothetical protein JNM68_13845 [Dinghuibacter sp.]|nr:hypothetical protein [Dinghuibacter sp.]
MLTIKIFLASSLELEPERRRIEIELYRRNKLLQAKGIFLQLDIWEDETARMQPEGTQQEYTKKAQAADIFVLLVHTKLGIYSEQEFEGAHSQFLNTGKPFVYIYCREPAKDADGSLQRFVQRMQELRHFPVMFSDETELWTKFSRELDRLELDGFAMGARSKNTGWVQSLRRGLNEIGVAVGNRPEKIFEHYGWLVETFLHKMSTAGGSTPNLRALSFIAGTWQASLRYICYIQMAQLLPLKIETAPEICTRFFNMSGKQYQQFDYCALLLAATQAIDGKGFVTEIQAFAEQLSQPGSELYIACRTLSQGYSQLQANTITGGTGIEQLYETWLAHLAYWLRKLAFLAKYRLASIKEITLSYRLGTPKNFVHLFGELHGIYAEVYSEREEYNTISIENHFTYNQSILLFRGTDINSCIGRIGDAGSYISLSPLVIDQSVYTGKPTQTPELFYFAGYEPGTRRYHFAQYKNEPLYGGLNEIATNKMLAVHAQNNNQHWLNELFEHMEQVFKPI